MELSVEEQDRVAELLRDQDRVRSDEELRDMLSQHVEMQLQVRVQAAELRRTFSLRMLTVFVFLVSAGTITLEWWAPILILFLFYMGMP